MRQTLKHLPSLTKNMPKAMVVPSTLRNVSERRREGEKERRREGDKERRREGDKETEPLLAQPWQVLRS